MDKTKQVNELLSKLKQSANKAIEKGSFEKALAAISAGCQIEYEFNQNYVDYDFENCVTKIAEHYRQSLKSKLDSFNPDKNTVLFYDGFGMDVRGVAKMYLSALKKNNYHIVYVTGNQAQGNLPETLSILEDADASVYYIDCYKSYTQWLDDLLNVIFETSPKAMLFYTLPYDSSGAVAFAVMDKLVDRFLIDLTDHAFWLGVNSNDYFCGSREMSASNQVYERKIDKNKLIKLGVNLIIEEGTDHSGLPFDVLTEKYIFSGGALYKTLGDENNYFYRIVDHILSGHKDIKFLYAGFGDTSKMDEILKKYPEQAYLISERKDFYFLIQHCVLYLNTYPMFGGMMMKYSANAGRIPVTLKHDNDSDGLLLDQADRRIEYDTYEELISDVDRLLSEPEYLKAREALLNGSVITEDRFVKNVFSTIENHKTDYNHSFEHIDTSKFRSEFYDRFDFNKAKDAVSRKINKSLMSEFPWILGNMMKRKIAK